MQLPRWLPTSWEGVRKAGRTTIIRVGVTICSLVVVYVCDRAAVRAAVIQVRPIATRDPSVVAIPAGGFLMGSTHGDEDETPVHRVQLDAFAIQRTEVTVSAYRACVAAGACSATGGEPYCNAGRARSEDHPINCVDWDQARAYCAWVGMRLPSEAEWEYAARGTDGRTYPWGESSPMSQLCWDGPGSELGLGRRRGTCAVGTHPAGRSAFGVDDMAGNVWEWTSGAYSPAYDQPPTQFRVVRGGTWFGYDRHDVRSSLRFRVDAKARDYGIGFRCARSI